MTLKEGYQCVDTIHTYIYQLQIDTWKSPEISSSIALQCHDKAAMATLVNT